MECGRGENQALSLDDYERYLREEEKSPATVTQYIREVRRFLEYTAYSAPDKETVIGYKEYMVGRFSPVSVNTKLAALNGFLRYSGYGHMCVKRLKIQKSPYCTENMELELEEYRSMVKEAKDMGDERMALVIRTLGSTGIRVSELRYITVEAVRQKEARITLKGKTRVILLPERICFELLCYAAEEGITTGSIFTTPAGKPLNRSYIWRMMKHIGEAAGVNRTKVFPHNLRHLFARMFYEECHDLSKLADVLGHSSVETSRIYTVSSGYEHRKLIESLELV